MSELIYTKEHMEVMRDEWRKEADRLREALEEIAYNSDGTNEMWRTACEALEGPQ